MRKGNIPVIIAISFTLLFVTLTGCATRPVRSERTDTYEQVMEAYRKILRNETTFREAFQSEYYPDGVPQGDRYYLDEYYITLYTEGGVAEPVLDFSVADLDGDQIPELIVNDKPCYNRLVFHCEEGEAYACLYGDKEFGEINTDGTGYWEIGSYYYGYGRLEFEKDVYRHIIIAECEVFRHTDTVEAYIYGESVSKEEFLAFFNAQWDKEDIVWYDLTEENIEVYVK